MQSSLVFSDINKFVDKYTRFMTKDVYISYDMNKSFLADYDYLKEELEKNQYLYQERSEYKKFFRIYRHSDEMLKLHNEKYLKNALSNYDDFFSNLGYKDLLDKNKKMLVLSNEDKMVLVIGKNYVPFIVSRIKYMNEFLNKDLSKLCILVSDDKDLELLRHEMDVYDLDVSLYGLKEYGLSTFKKNEKYIDEDVLYRELVDYMVKMFLDKDRFSSFYKVFSSDIYLNRDYKDFDTFRDYHAYMYKRMFLESKLSLKRFILRETKKRRGYFKSIDNYYFDCKEMVDVANFLYLNSIPYVYDIDKRCFVCDGRDSISFEEGSSIVLNKKSKFLEELVYELVKRQYGMEKRSDEDVYAMLRDTTIDSYFSEFIRDKLIPSFYYYEENNNFDGTIFNGKQKEELEGMYKYYLEFKKNNCYLSDYDIHSRVQDKINSEKKDYFVMLGNSSYVFNKSNLVILKDYPKIELIKNNLRFLYDYRVYLNENKYLAVRDCYLSMDELNKLTSKFLSSNLNYLNGEIENNRERICVCFYEEESKLRCYRNLSLEVLKIVSCEKGKKICFSLDKNEMKYLINGNYFIKHGSNSLESEYGIIDCISFKNIHKKYDDIVFPFLIKDSYHNGIVLGDDIYKIKTLLFMAVSRCKNRVYLMCPNSKKKKYIGLFKGLSYVEFL